MANLKLSGIVTQISGKFAGSIFQKTANGQILKNNSYSQQHATPKQSAQRSRLYPTTQLWRALNDTQRALWDAETVNYPYTNKVGETVYYNGYQLHNYLNQNLQLVSQSYISVPATFEAPETPLINFNTFTSSTMNVQYSITSDNYAFVLYASKYQDSSLMPNVSRFKLAARTLNTGSSSNFSFASAYKNVFGDASAGQTVWLYIKPVNKITGAVAPLTNIVHRVRS